MRSIESRWFLLFDLALKFMSWNCRRSLDAHNILLILLNKLLLTELRHRTTCHSIQHPWFVFFKLRVYELILVYLLLSRCQVRFIAETMLRNIIYLLIARILGLHGNLLIKHFLHVHHSTAILDEVWPMMLHLCGGFCVRQVFFLGLGGISRWGQLLPIIRYWKRRGLFIYILRRDACIHRSLKLKLRFENTWQLRLLCCSSLRIWSLH
jgi:hypothetical protein